MIKETLNYLPISENIQDFFKEKSIDRELFFKMSIILIDEEFYFILNHYKIKKKYKVFKK